MQAMRDVLVQRTPKGLTYLADACAGPPVPPHPNDPLLQHSYIYTNPQIVPILRLNSLRLTSPRHNSLPQALPIARLGHVDAEARDGAPVVLRGGDAGAWHGGRATAPHSYITTHIAHSTCMLLSTVQLRTVRCARCTRMRRARA